MKLKDIVKNLDKSEKNSSWFNLESFANHALGLNFWFDKEPERLKCYFFLNWYCTDTWVGGRLYFLDDKLICGSWQSGRKMDEKFYWASKEVYKETKQYVLSLMMEQEDDEPELEPLNFEEEYNEGFEISYSSQLLTDKVIYQPTREIVNVVEKYHDMSKIDMWSKVKVRFESGEERVEDMKNIRVPYNLVS